MTGPSPDRPDAIEFARKVCEAATPGPWSIDPDGPTEWDVFGDAELVATLLSADDARAVALLGSTWREALAVVDEVAAQIRCDCGTRRAASDGPCGVCTTLDAYRAAVSEWARRQGRDE